MDMTVGKTSESGNQNVTDDPVDLDSHRDLAARKRIAIRRKLVETRTARHAFLLCQEDFERNIMNAPAQTWTEAVARAEFLVQVLADATDTKRPCCKDLVADALKTLARLSDHAKEHGE